MFPSLGLFGRVQCPSLDTCQIFSCIFNHDRIELSSPLEASRSLPDEGPARKKRRIGEINSGITTSCTNPLGLQASQKSVLKREEMPRKTTSLLAKDISPLPVSRSRKPVESGTTGTEPDGPAPEKEDRNSKRREGINKPKETLNPRVLAKPPATHSVRLSILKMLHEQMKRLNDEAAKAKGGNYSKDLVLNPDELITMALDEEERIAKDDVSVYSNVIKLRIVRLKKMKVDEWRGDLLDSFRKKYFPEPPSAPKQKEIKTGLTEGAEIAVLSNLVTHLKGLEQFGYVTAAPTQEQVERAMMGTQAADGHETCDRCGSRFQSFPGRREEDGALTSGGTCTYHPGKPVYAKRDSPVFSCCNKGLGDSRGCTKASSHVFKISEVKRLASVLQFESTPPQPGKTGLKPLCFDCEMGYTTLGLELIRLTAVSWPDNKTVIDVLVRPMGEILDLNSRYSGVFPEHFSNAKRYGEVPPKDDAPRTGNQSQEPMEMVESPAAARALLFSFLQPETPLMGHAIDNDLNACRIIHPTVIDTVLLYPHPKGLPSRFSLKGLAKKYLERNIQMGGSRGHDSKEDAVATGDLVKVKVASKWEQMTRQGWMVRDDVLYPPFPKEDLPNKRRGVLSAGGARPKRPEESHTVEDGF